MEHVMFTIAEELNVGDEYTTSFQNKTTLGHRLGDGWIWTM